MKFFQYTSFFIENFSLKLKIKYYKFEYQTIMTEKKLADKEKIDAILQHFHINLAEFSRKLDVKTDTIYSVFFEKTKGFSMEILRKITKAFPEISPYWLITGEGSMLAGAVEQHNINGDNLNNPRHNAPQKAKKTTLSVVFSLSSQRYYFSVIFNPNVVAIFSSVLMVVPLSPRSILA